MSTKDHIQSTIELFRKLATQRHEGYVAGESEAMDYYYRGKDGAFELAAEHLERIMGYKSNTFELPED